MQACLNDCPVGSSPSAKMAELYLSGETAANIAESVERAIRTRRALPGDRLPSVREAGDLLGVSRNTVASAYARLRDAGIIVGGAGRGGMRIASVEPFEGRAIALPANVHDLASGNVDPAFLPRLEKVLGDVDLAPTGYDANGDEPLLVELSRERLSAEGLVCDHICFLSGALDAIERAMRAHLRAGATVLVEDPGFPPLHDLLRSMGLRLKPMPMDEEGPLVEALAAGLASGAAAVVITPRAQNPMGADITAKRAAALSRVLTRFPDALVVLDDHWGPLSESGLELLPPKKGRWLFIRSVSKFLGPDYRLAIAVGDEVTIGRIRRQHALGPRWVSRLVQRMVVALWRDPRTEHLLEEGRTAYRNRRAAFVDELGREGLSSFGRSGVHVWVPVPREGDVVQGMLGFGWAVQAGEPFRLESGPAVRIGLANLTSGHAREAAADLVKVLQGPRRVIS